MTFCTYDTNCQKPIIIQKLAEEKEQLKQKIEQLEKELEKLEDEHILLLEENARYFKLITLLKKEKKELETQEILEGRNEN